MEEACRFGLNDAFLIQPLCTIGLRGERKMKNQEWQEEKNSRREYRHREHRHEEQRYGEQRRRRRQRELRRKILGFCLFTFLLGVLFGKIVFAKETGLLAQAQERMSMAGEGSAGEGSGDRGGKAEAGAGYGGDSARGELSENYSSNDWRLTLVNATHPVEEGYAPELAEIENNYDFDARAVSFLQEMLADGRKEGLDFWVCSAYRTIEKQTELYEDKVRRLEAEGMSHTEALREAGTVVAYPGTSEHNLGLAVDIVARDYQILDEKQEQTAEQQWLMENCWKYGFILRYPTDKTEETGIIYEPWHYRYVGEKAAREIMERGICLEEYLGEA